MAPKLGWRLVYRVVTTTLGLSIVTNRSQQRVPRPSSGEAFNPVCAGVSETAGAEKAVGNSAAEIQ